VGLSVSVAKAFMKRCGDRKKGLMPGAVFHEFRVDLVEGDYGLYFVVSKILWLFARR